MQLDLNQAFLHPATPYPFEADVTLDAQDVSGETISFDPVHLKGSYFVADDTVRIEGRLTTTAHGSCCLCLEPADAPIDVSFDEMFRKDADELNDECFRYEGKMLPLDHMTLTLVMLNLPMRFVCSENCQGSEEWKAWHNESPQEEQKQEDTYQPFAALKDLMDENQKQ